MEDSKSGTPTYKSKTPSKLMKPTSTVFPSPPKENTLLPEEKTKNYTSGILKISPPPPENSKPDPPSSKSPSTLNSNGLLLVLKPESKSGI